MVAKFQKTKKWESIKRFVFPIILGIIFVGMAVFLAFTNVKINQRREQMLDRIKNLQKEVQDLEERNNNLQQSAGETGDQEYLERVAREQLDLKKEGEEVVVISKEPGANDESSPENAGSTVKKRKPWDPRAWWDWIKSQI